MRSFSVQIIAVVVMILAVILAMRFWDGALPALPPMPVIKGLSEIGSRPLATDTPCPATEGELSPGAEPVWLRYPAPTGRDFPRAAQNAGVSGEVALECLAHPNGQVSGCQVIEETPTGYGFGKNAIRVVKRGCLTPFAEDRGPVSLTVRIPFILKS